MGGFGTVTLGEGADQIEQVASQLQLRLGLPAQRFERVLLFSGERARHAIDDAQRAEGVAIARDERRAGIKTDVRVAADQRILAKPLVVERVGHDEDAASPDGVRAERHAARGFGHRHADTRLEPLPVLVDQRDQRDRRTADLRGEQDDVVECLFGLGVEDAIGPE